jgi:hypothetical protein
MSRLRGSWDRLQPGSKRRWMRGGRTEAEGRYLYESGEPPPEAKSKGERKQEVRALVRKADHDALAPDQQWADKINEADTRLTASYAGMVAAVLDMAATFTAAKADLPHGSFAPMIEHKTRFSLRTAELYMQVGDHPVLSNPQHVATLPPFVSTLGVLAQLEPPDLERAIADGKVTPELDRRLAKHVVWDYHPDTAWPAPLPPAPPEPPADADDQDDDELVTLTSRSGKVLHATKDSDGRMLVGKALGEADAAEVLRAADADDGSLVPLDTSMLDEPEEPGISRKEARDFRRVAQMPEDEFARYLGIDPDKFADAQARLLGPDDPSYSVEAVEAARKRMEATDDPAELHALLRFARTARNYKAAQVLCVERKIGLTLLRFDDKFGPEVTAEIIKPGGVEAFVRAFNKLRPRAPAAAP